MTNSIEIYCIACGNTTATTITTAPLLISPGSFLTEFECMHCKTTFRIEIHYYPAEAQ
jgi:hypothetical protein